MSHERGMEKEHVTHILSWSKWVDTVEIYWEGSRNKIKQMQIFLTFRNLNTLQVIFMAFASSSINLLRNFQVFHCKRYPHRAFIILLTLSAIIKYAKRENLSARNSFYSSPYGANMIVIQSISRHFIGHICYATLSTRWDGNEKSKYNNKKLNFTQSFFFAGIPNWWYYVD